MNSNNRINNWTPLHTRIIASRVGDGTLNVHKKVVWDNKHIDNMLELLKQLNISHWKPVIGDKYGTYKLVLPGFIFKEFSRIFNKDYEKIITDQVYLLNCINGLDKSHKIQALCSLIFDDGSFVNWRPVIFEDQNKEVVMKVKEIWDSLFPKTSKIAYITTKNKTKVYHLFSNRNGVISLFREIKDSEKKLGNIANLWHKQEALEWRYKKATNERAKKLYETKFNKERWKNLLLENLKINKTLKFSQFETILGLSMDRTRTIVKGLLREEKIGIIKASKNSKYYLKNYDFFSSL